MKLKYKIILPLLFSFILIILFIQGKEYTLPNQNEITQRVNYLKRLTDTTENSKNEVAKLGSFNPEFSLFTYAFTTYAITNLVIKKSINKKQATQIIENCIQNILESEKFYLFNSSGNISYPDSTAEISILFFGHLNLMLGCYKLITNNDKYADLNKSITDNFCNRYNKSISQNLESYSGNIWVPDNAVGIASIKLFSRNYNSDCDSVCINWVKKLKSNYTNNETGLLCSTIDPETAKPLEEARGSMLSWSIMFIYQFDKEYAIDLYTKYKKHFSTNFLVYQLFKEKQSDHSTGEGDNDSGPLILGYSIPANAFALSNAIISNDLVTARRIERLINTGAKIKLHNNELSYKVRFVNLDVSPMAEAIILHGMSVEKWVD